MEQDHGCVHVAKAATFQLGQHVPISKKKIRFAKAAEQNSSTEIFRVEKVNDRRPRAVYGLEVLNGTPIDGQFYCKELTPVRITDRTAYKINKILDKDVRRGIREYLVRWRSYSQNFDSCVPAACVKYI